jgi:hypothetical protein
MCLLFLQILKSMLLWEIMTFTLKTSSQQGATISTVKLQNCGDPGLVMNPSLSSEKVLAVCQALI